jgi:hypothetical protein
VSELLGLGGKLRAGKDAVGDYLAENKNFVKLGMSDALNEALLKLDPWIPVVGERVVEHWETEEESGTKYYYEGDWLRYRKFHELLGYVEAKKNPEVRRLLQVLGTEVGREMIDPDVWVKIAEAKIKKLWSEGHNVVITAVRFPNELEMIARLGGTTVWVERPEEARGVSEGVNGAHASETSVSRDDFDLTIDNTGTLEDLYGWTDAILDGLEPRYTTQPYWGGTWREHITPPYDR